MNVLGVCNSDMEFIYTLAGWEGSAHDGRVLRDALIRPNGLKVPKGMDASDGANPDTKSQKSRDYKTWTPELDAALIRAMLQLVENKEVESGNFQNGGFKKIETLMQTIIPGCPMKVVPHIKSRHGLFKNKYIAITEVKNGGASGFGWDESKQQIVADDEVFQGWAKRFPGSKGLNKKPFPYYDQLARIFGKDRAEGGESESPADVQGPEAAAGVRVPAADTETFVDAASAFDDEASQRELESMINQGIDGRNMMNVASRVSASTGTSKKPRKEVVATGMTEEIAKFHPLLEKTAASIERMVNSLCHDDDIMIRRGSLYSEISAVDGLSNDQVVAATLALMKDDQAAQLYRQLPTDEDKFNFLISLIN
ncbi:hypothetical protein LINPERPRIM_LOCUS11242 [Linum perenne]